MHKLDFSKSSPKSLKRLSKIQSKIVKFDKKHHGPHKKRRALLSKRASALSEALGVKVHSLFD